jgi:hypothetical protein
MLRFENSRSIIFAGRDNVLVIRRERQTAYEIRVLPSGRDEFPLFYIPKPDDFAR